MRKRILLPTLAIVVAVIIVLTNATTSTSAGATEPEIGFSPTAVTVQTGQTFYLTVVVNEVSDLYGWQLDAKYNTEYLEFVKVEEDTLLKSDGASTYFAAPATEPGKILHGVTTRLSSNVGIDGSGAIVHIFFRALKDTSGTTVTLHQLQLVDCNAEEISKHYINHGKCKVTISAGAPVYSQ